jgi:hypothetical protein
MTFIWQVQSDSSRKTAYLTYISKAQNLLDCLGFAAEQSMQRRDCYRESLPCLAHTARYTSGQVETKGASTIADPNAGTLALLLLLLPSSASVILSLAPSQQLPQR